MPKHESCSEKLNYLHYKELLSDTIASLDENYSFDNPNRYAINVKNSFEFGIYPTSRSRLRKMETKFGLQGDSWNDYSFRTLYHLYYRPNLEDNKVEYIGGVKILRLGQRKGEPLQISESFSFLEENFCSIGTSLDYYERLNSLPEDDRKYIVKALRDVAAFPELVSIFGDEDGWYQSLFRDNNSWDTYLEEASALFHGNFEELVDVDRELEYFLGSHGSYIDLNFKAILPSDYSGPYRRLGPSNVRTVLPERVIVLIGRNGSGKSTILSRIAHLAFASPAARKARSLKSFGHFEPAGIGFMRVITLSYSAFDNFTVPGQHEKDIEQITLDIERGTGRYIYCGLRDIAGEARSKLNLSSDINPMTVPNADDVLEKSSITKLKSIEQLADEFSVLITRITNRDDRKELFVEALEPLLADPSFVELKSQIDFLFDGEYARALFLSWSTGHKIAIHAVASLTANTTQRSLILFDEPEMHLHPPLAAALMHSVRIILHELNAFCIIATHSPVLLQETISQHVRIIQRQGDQISTHIPSSETFGENVGLLTYSTFGLTASATDFHKILDLLVRGCSSINEIDDFFENGLSAQARAYVMAKFAVTKGIL